MSKQIFKKINFHQAFLEMILIAFGVFCALAAQSWWESKQDQASELQYLLALQQDFRANQQNFIETTDQISGVLQAIAAVFTMIADEKEQELPDSFSKTLGRAYFLYHSFQITGTYDDMVNAGNLRLISSESLRRNLAQFTVSLEHVKSYEKELGNSYYRLQAPFVNRHFLTSEFGWYEPGSDTEPEMMELFGRTPKSRFAPDAAAARSLEFWNLLFTWKGAYSDQLNMYFISRDLCEEIIAKLET
jgi:hypothetical protein